MIKFEKKEMMVFKSDELLTELEKYVATHMNFVKGLKNVPEAILKQKTTEESWSVLDCLEHLNLYAIFYNKEIKKRIQASKLVASPTFKSGFLGNKFALDMLPKQRMKTMNAFKSKNPIYSDLSKEIVLNAFVNHQQEVLKLLESAENENLTKIKTSLTIPILKFRLGDTFRFVIYHNERHIVQARNVLKQF